jgi:metal-responsive CopG/Arc/MetJ family transcriptional regulator
MAAIRIDLPQALMRDLTSVAAAMGFSPQELFRQITEQYLAERRRKIIDVADHVIDQRAGLLASLSDR